MLWRYQERQPRHTFCRLEPCTVCSNSEGVEVALNVLDGSQTDGRSGGHCKKGVKVDSNAFL